MSECLQYGAKYYVEIMKLLLSVIESHVRLKETNRLLQAKVIIRVHLWMADVTNGSKLLTSKKRNESSFHKEQERTTELKLTTY